MWRHNPVQTGVFNGITLQKKKRHCLRLVSNQCLPLLQLMKKILRSCYNQHSWGLHSHHQQGLCGDADEQDACQTHGKDRSETIAKIFNCWKRKESAILVPSKGTLWDDEECIIILQETDIRAEGDGFWSQLIQSLHCQQDSEREPDDDLMACGWLDD